MSRAGLKRNRILFDKRTVTADGYGNQVSGWDEQFEVWARRRNLVGGESVIASRLQGVQPVVLTVLRSSETEIVTSEWRARDARSGEVLSTSAMLSKPRPKSSAGKLSAGRCVVPSRSRTVLLYSVRFRR